MRARSRGVNFPPNNGPSGDLDGCLCRRSFELVEINFPVWMASRQQCRRREDVVHLGMAQAPLDAQRWSLPFSWAFRAFFWASAVLVIGHSTRQNGPCGRYSLAILLHHASALVDLFMHYSVRRFKEPVPLRSLPIRSAKPIRHVVGNVIIPPGVASVKCFFADHPRSFAGHHESFGVLVGLFGWPTAATGVAQTSPL